MMVISRKLCSRFNLTYRIGRKKSPVVNGRLLFYQVKPGKARPKQPSAESNGFSCSKGKRDTISLRGLRRAGETIPLALLLYTKRRAASIPLLLIFLNSCPFTAVCAHHHYILRVDKCPVNQKKGKYLQGLALTVC